MVCMSSSPLATGRLRTRLLGRLLGEGAELPPRPRRAPAQRRPAGSTSRVMETVIREAYFGRWDIPRPPDRRHCWTLRSGSDPVSRTPSVGQSRFAGASPNRASGLPLAPQGLCAFWATFGSSCGEQNAEYGRVAGHRGEVQIGSPGVSGNGTLAAIAAGSTQVLPIALGAVMRDAEHLAVGKVRSATLRPGSDVVGLHLAQLVDTDGVVVAAAGAHGTV